MANLLERVRNIPERVRSRIYPYLVTAVGVLAFAIYLPILPGGLIWDDFSIFNFEFMGGRGTAIDAITQPFLAQYFRPLTALSYYVDLTSPLSSTYHLHTVAVAMHAATAMAVVALVSSLFGRRGIALAAGMLFAVQPAQLMTAGWIGARCDALSTLLATLFAWTLVVSQRRQSLGWLGASATFYFLATLTKEQAVPLLVLVPLAVVCFSPGGARWPVIAGQTAPFVAATALFGSLWLASGIVPPAAASYGIATRVGLLGNTTFHYLRLFLVPNRQALYIYSLEEYSGATALLGLVALVALALATVMIWRRNRAIAWLLIFALLPALPVLNLLPLPSLLVGVYRVSMCGPAVAALLVCGTVALLRTRAALLAPVLLLPSLIGLVPNVSVLRNQAAFFTAVHQSDPKNLYITPDYVISLDRRTETARAKAAVDEALNLAFGGDRWKAYDAVYGLVGSDPSIYARIESSQKSRTVAIRTLGKLLALKATLLADAGDTRDAKALFWATTRIDPSSSAGWDGLGDTDRILGGRQWEWAYKRSLLVKPDDVHAAIGVYEACRQRGEPSLSRFYIERCVAAGPMFGKPYLLLAQMRADEGDIEGARDLVGRARQTLNAPNEIEQTIVHIDRAAARVKTGRS